MKNNLFKDRIRTVDSEHPDPEIIAEAVRILKSGGVIMFPTKCLYGLGADALNPDAVNRIYQIKRRSAEKPLLVLIANRSELNRLVKNIPPEAEKMMEAFWPGRVTIVFEAADKVLPGLTAGTGKLGIRIPEHPVARSLTQKMGAPITGTSANFSGSPGCNRIDQADSMMAGQLDLILDAGTLQGGLGSTVVDVTTQSPRILRVGSIPEEDIRNAVKN